MTTATRPGSFQYPTAATSMAPTDQATMDAAVEALQAHKDAWVGVSPSERSKLMAQLMRDFYAIADRWVAASMEAKGLAPDSPLAGEEWGAGVYTTIRHMRQYRDSLADIARSGAPRIPGSVSALPNGQIAARVFPQTTYDSLFFTGLTADVWMEPGVTKKNLRENQASVYRTPHAGKVALVLGAGNVSSIGPLDILYKLFNEDQVVVCKMNPVNAYLGPLIEVAFRALIDGGYLRVVYGGAAEGAYLCNHPGVEEVHITGSDKTFDAIVWGPGAEGAARKATGQPLLTKRITGELGNVSPVIVVPGNWSASDIQYQAEHLVSMLTNNAGFNCNATRVIVTHAGWKQRDDLLKAIRAVFAKTPSRAAYYPGARDRHAAFSSAHPEAEQFGSGEGDALPWMFIAGVAPEAADDMVFTTEAFCGLFAETALEAASPAEFVNRAVDFANDEIWGTLNVTLLAHSSSLKDAAVGKAVDDAITNLRFGTVGLNYWAGTNFVLGTTTWGAFPGHPLTDIQSGTGVVHNTLMFDRPQKTVMRAPFRSTPTPPWFATHARAGRAVFRKLADFEMNPSPGKVPSIVISAVRG
jgi:acyl-CoA reductase-like NAD-dependent aldehyde dehydrogenase